MPSTPPSLPADRRVDGRVVVVTGATSGIGLAAAQQASDEGDAVVLVARSAERLEEVADECRSRGALEVLAVPTDVGDDSAVASLVDQVLDRFGRIDGVVNSAGVVTYGRTEDVPAEVFDGVLRTNVTGSVNVARHVLPVLREQGHGTLVLIGSVIGHIATPGMTPYAVSKWAVRALARQLQLENRDRPGIVAYVAPGGVDTPIYLQAGNYSGFVGRPPPPVVSPEKVARKALQLTRHPRAGVLGRVQVGPANTVMRLGFSLLPGVFDRLVGPLVPLASKDRTESVLPTPGNVLEPQPKLERLRGEQGNALVGILRNLPAVLPGRRTP